MKGAPRTGDKVTPNCAKTAPAEAIGAFRAQHLDLVARKIIGETGAVSVLVNESESPLAWLARRKGRDGRTMISPNQFIAGEKLREDFTRGHLSPRVTSDWSAPAGRSRSFAAAGEMTELMVAARQRVRLAMEACGPEFAGLLIDVCCFLRGLEEVERERGWPLRSAKIVLQLALDRLARHYGLRDEARGDLSAHVRTWLAADAGFTSE
ncbi:DUF6456 domain-containing protein [uncultured Bradyrhizobium sp.]|uniref:DUF6456 domain-containing protein n=1 Tax=uncultured Bradyrhizobium sp. TaxID=199684 RepID=UPI0035CC3A38